MIVHTNIDKYTIFYTIMHGLQICTINKRLVITVIEVTTDFYDAIRLNIF